MSNHHEARARWRKLIRQQQASGLSASAYCRRTGVSQWSFYSWRRKLRDEATFTEVKITSKREGTDLATTAGEIELRLPGRRCVVVRPGFDRPTLVELLHILEQNGSDLTVREAGT